MDIAAFLGSVESFQGLVQEEIAELAARATVVRVGDGEAVVRQGERGAAVWVITGGTAEVRKPDRSGEQKALATLSAGSVLGEMSVMAKEPATADVVARGTLQLVQIPGDIFFRVFHKNQRALGKLSREMAKRYSRIARH